MAVRSTMASLIAKTRLLIADPTGTPFFTDQQIQDDLDAYRDDIRYEPMTIAVSIVNAASTNNVATTIFGDFYSKYKWWEDDYTIQGYQGGAAWVVLNGNIITAEPVVGHWSFEANIFTAGTAPGQLPPLFLTGKIFDVNRTAANLLEFWAANYTNSYDFQSQGQVFHISQIMAAKLKLAEYYRKRAKPLTIKMTRTDATQIGSREMRLLEGGDRIKQDGFS